MWIYYNETSNRQSVVVPHGQVVRQGDGFDIYLAFEGGTISEKGYTSFTLRYQIPSETTSRLFETILADKAEEIVFEKLNDSEVTYSLKDGQTYDVIHFSINPGQLITSEDGDLKIEFSIIKTAGNTNQTLTSTTKIYIEQSLDYLNSLVQSIEPTEADKILNLIYKNILAVTSTWDKASGAPVLHDAENDFVFRSIGTRSITIFYGECTLSRDVDDFEVVATTTAVNKELFGDSFITGKLISGDEDRGTDREGIVRLNSTTNKLEFLVGPGKSGDKLKFNGIIRIDYTNDFSELESQQAIPYVPMIGTEAFGGNFAGGTDASYNLGAIQKRWNNLYLSGYLSDGIYSISIANLVNSGSDFTHLTLSLIPNTTNTINLGSQSKQWKNLYIAGNISDNAGHTFKVSDIADIQVMLSSHSTSITTVEQRANGFDAKFTTVEGNISTLNDDVDELDSGLTTTNSTVAELSATSAGIRADFNTYVETNNARSATIEANVSGLTSKVSTKTTTYNSATTPATPAGGFVTGDLWFDTTNNVWKIWNGTQWNLARDSEVNTLSSSYSSLSQTVSGISATVGQHTTQIADLPTKEFVNSSIASNTGDPKGTLDATTDLGLTKPATTSAIATALNSHTFTPAPKNNDYCFVINEDSSQNSVYERFKYSTTSSSWIWEYALNNSSFTQAQWDAINSGIDTTKVAQIVSDAQKVATLEEDVDSITATVESHETDIATLTTDLGEAEATILSHASSISTLQTTTTGISATVSSHTQSIATAQSTADNAQDTADDAQEAADDAQDAAEAAQLTANSKTTTYRQSEAPSTPHNGDLWFYTGVNVFTSVTVTSFTSTSQYVGYYVEVSSVKTLVTTANKDTLSITPGTTPAYSLTRGNNKWYIYQSANTSWNECTDSQLTYVADKETALEVTVNGISGRVSTLENDHVSESEITQLSNQISSKVSSSGGTTSSFGWNLDTTGFSLWSNDNQVFKVDSSNTTMYGIDLEFARQQTTQGDSTIYYEAKVDETGYKIYRYSTQQAVQSSSNVIFGPLGVRANEQAVSLASYCGEKQAFINLDGTGALGTGGVYLGTIDGSNYSSMRLGSSSYPNDAVFNGKVRQDNFYFTKGYFKDKDDSSIACSSWTNDSTHDITFSDFTNIVSATITVKKNGTAGYKPQIVITNISGNIVTVALDESNTGLVGLYFMVYGK